MAEQSCPINITDLGQIKVVALPEDRANDYREAMTLAKAEAARHFAEYMLVSWYDRDRDFESPPHASECSAGGPKNGYYLYGLSHGARLKVDIGNGRFVFFFTPVEW
jgi:hypothetical protein